MSIEGLGNKFQQARNSRGISLEDAARVTKIRQSRLAEIEADDYSNFPSLAYARGFLQIYGKFLDVDVSPYLDAFETSEHMTVDGYSYLQENPAPRPARTQVIRHRDPNRTSILPLVIGLLVLFFGFWFIRLILNVQRIGPRQAETAPTSTPVPAATIATITASPLPQTQSPPRVAATVPPATAPIVSAPSGATTPVATPPPRALPVPTEPEVRRAQPVHAEDLAAAASNNSESATRVEIRPLKKTYMQVTVDDDPAKPAFERWVSPADGVVQFRGHHFNVRVLDREAVQIRKNGKLVSADDADITIE